MTLSCEALSTLQSEGVIFSTPFQITRYVSSITGRKNAAAKFAAALLKVALGRKKQESESLGNQFRIDYGKKKQYFVSSVLTYFMITWPKNSQQNLFSITKSQNRPSPSWMQIAKNAALLVKKKMRDAIICRHPKTREKRERCARALVLYFPRRRERSTFLQFLLRSVVRRLRATSLFVH